MKNEKIVIYRNLGEVHYRKNRKARNLTIRITRKGEIRVTIPGAAGFKAAEAFLFRKMGWIEKKIKEINDQKISEPGYASGDQIDMLQHKLWIKSSETGELSLQREGADFYLGIPENYNPGDREHCAALSSLVADIGLASARETLPGILAKLADENGFTCQKITVRKMKSRWGSCSSKNNISLNSALVFLPYELVEYVILHELVHTVHKNHGTLFWEELIRHLPDAKVRRRALGRHTIMA